MRSSIFILAALVFLGRLAPVAFTQERPRLVVLTDFYKDPDDKQPMIRLLSCANEFEIEGLIATSLVYGDGAVHPEWIKAVIDDYGEGLACLRQHEQDGFEYPTAESLKRIVKAGAPVIRKWAGRSKGFPVPYPVGTRDTRTSDPPEKWIGPGKDTEASEHIIDVVDRDDPRPVWVTVCGGAMDLAQALWNVRNERTEAESNRFVGKLRVYQISWQDTGAVWIWNNVPGLFLIQSSGAQRGIYAEGPAFMRNGDWVRANVSQGHGRLGAGYPKADVDGVKEGDTPSFLHLLAPGLSDPEHPEWGGWGGRFQPAGRSRRFYVAARDEHPESDDATRQAQWTIGRWNPAISNDFAARMDWCVRPYKDANHHPAVQVFGDSTRKVLHRKVAAGESVSLDASGTNDPDGDSVNFHWWRYSEPGSYPESVSIRRERSANASFVAPVVSRPQTLHIVLAVTDSGQPPLTSYRRVIFTITPPESTKAR